MAIKKRVTFIDDRGYEHNVRDMDTSHIINVLNLYRNKIYTIDFFAKEVAHRHLSEETMDCLRYEFDENIELLCKELNRRCRKKGCKGLKDKEKDALDLLADY
jgi:hypothetical protein